MHYFSIVTVFSVPLLNMTSSSILETTLMQSISCLAAVPSKSIGWFFRALRPTSTLPDLDWSAPASTCRFFFSAMTFLTSAISFDRAIKSSPAMLSYLCLPSPWPCFWAVPASSHHLRCCSRQPHHKTFACEAAGFWAQPDFHHHFRLLVSHPLQPAGQRFFQGAVSWDRISCHIPSGRYSAIPLSSWRFYFIRLCGRQCRISRRPAVL